MITDQVIEAIQEHKDISTGLLHIFIKQTSASLMHNENADPTVRQYFESHFNKYVPENASYYRHTYEGADDMPTHIKSSLMGVSVHISITNVKLDLGIWQGIYLGEHRDRGGVRSLVITIMGS